MFFLDKFVNIYGIAFLERKIELKRKVSLYYSRLEKIFEWCIIFSVYIKNYKNAEMTRTRKLTKFINSKIQKTSTFSIT